MRFVSPNVSTEESSPSGTFATGRAAASASVRPGATELSSAVDTSRRGRRGLPEERFRHGVPVWRHGLELSDRLDERNVDDVVALERRHPAEVPLMSEICRL